MSRDEAYDVWITRDERPVVAESVSAHAQQLRTSGAHFWERYSTLEAAIAARTRLTSQQLEEGE